MRRPVIGITSNFGPDEADPPRLQAYLGAGYTDAIFMAGGLPQPIPVPREYDDALLDELLRRYDGLMFTGGLDVPPELYGQTPHPQTRVLHERRARFELDVFRRADAARLPILAICLGHQVACVARGGRLIQHLDDQRRDSAQTGASRTHPTVTTATAPADTPRSPATVHRPTGAPDAFHVVRIAADSQLARIVGTTQLEVNSRHHQAADGEHLGRGLRVVAHAPDGVVEAAEDCDGRFLLTVQWHPEDLLDRAEHLRLFEALVAEAARARQRATAL